MAADGFVTPSLTVASTDRRKPKPELRVDGHRCGMRAKDAVGRFGEQVAAEHLESAGLRVIARNWRCRAGELDIIARDGSELVFVEVKTRSSLTFGEPAEAVDWAKAARIRRLALQWMASDRDTGGGTYWTSVRFDVICVLRRGSGTPDVQHLTGAF
ncbi:MAG: putative endonuclease [Pseudonocardiales bacterium]|jgi:putative endonuclease|nr:putative endonuclease [Pseudonocardiales bacterium]